MLGLAGDDIPLSARIDAVADIDIVAFNCNVRFARPFVRSGVIPMFPGTRTRWRSVVAVIVSIIIWPSFCNAEVDEV